MTQKAVHTAIDFLHLWSYVISNLMTAFSCVTRPLLLAPRRLAFWCSSFSCGWIVC